MNKKIVQSLNDYRNAVIFHNSIAACETTLYLRMVLPKDEYNILDHSDWDSRSTFEKQTLLLFIQELINKYRQDPQPSNFKKTLL